MRDTLDSCRRVSATPFCIRINIKRVAGGAAHMRILKQKRLPRVTPRAFSSKELSILAYSFGFILGLRCTKTSYSG